MDKQDKHMAKDLSIPDKKGNHTFLVNGKYQKIYRKTSEEGSKGTSSATNQREAVMTSISNIN